MHLNLKTEYKPAIRKFMQYHYTTEKLCQLLAHAQNGLLCYQSCCCFVGIVTADHALKGQNPVVGRTHYEAAKLLEDARAAELAFALLNTNPFNAELHAEQDRVRRLRLIPMIKAELRRRERLATKEASHEPIHEVDQEQHSAVHAA